MRKLKFNKVDSDAVNIEQQVAGDPAMRKDLR